MSRGEFQLRMGLTREKATGSYAEGLAKAQVATETISLSFCQGVRDVL